MENTGASCEFQYKRRITLTQARREEMENENQISAEVTPSVEGESFPDASEIEVPALDCTIDIDKIPGMKLTLKSSLGEFQNLMSEGLGDHPEVLDLFRENTTFSHFLDVECIPPPLFLRQLIAREAKIKRKGEMCLDICKGLDREKKKEGQEMDAVKMATLLFVVVVLLGPANRDKSAIPNWIQGMIAQWTAVLGFPWGTWAFMESLGSLRKDLTAKAKSIGRGASSTMYYTGFLLPIGKKKTWAEIRPRDGKDRSSAEGRVPRKTTPEIVGSGRLLIPAKRTLEMETMEGDGDAETRRCCRRR
ncbi:unnamed protein product [Cuscuta campestris]|uniref:DUF1985 domain-containing protein n=1 Tax=Cuscuta campestris TaxID=132261 RepID=A0A484L394_9ASTE|nr:unnamed protein product [Cuscuta campestris]